MSAKKLKVIVTRGDKLDVADWVEGEPEWIGPSGGGNGGGDGPSWGPAVFAIVASILAIAATVWLIKSQSQELGKPLVPTVADLSSVHASVSVNGADVRKLVRLSVGDKVATNDAGRARVRLDDGTTVVLDRATELTPTNDGFEIGKGRAFVEGVASARTVITLGRATTTLSGVSAGIDRSGKATKVYVANAELTIKSNDRETTVHAGETATIQEDGAVRVEPERAWDDWTNGLASPWGASGSPRRAVGELWGRAGTSSSPLTIRAHDVRTTITREVAETEVRTTFFNAGSNTVAGDYRMAVPEGAIIARFAVMRGESTSEGKIGLAARKQSLAWTNAEVLEWAGEGWVRGAIQSIQPGATVTVIVSYVEWLVPRPKDGGKSLVVSYRYPMASDVAPPRIGEFSARVDAGPSNPIAVAAGLGAKVEGRAAVVRKPDFSPTADLVVDVEIEPWIAEKDAPQASSLWSGGAPMPPARLYAAPPGDDDDAGGTVVVRAEVPEEKGGGVTLALVLDVSASIEPALLDAERALATAIVSSLGPDDRVVVIAADQTTRAIGPAAMGPLDDARRKAITEGLAKLSGGGASDLGRAIEAGADAIPSDTPSGMVVYIGDGWPTSGDTTTNAIKARLARRSGGAPRIGAVAVGPLANKRALASLARGTGPVLEIASSEDAARAAITLVADALKPAVAGVEIAFGPEVERIYPRSPRAVAAGETFMAVGRVRGGLPKEITVRWRDAKGAHEEKRALLIEKAPNEGDVARRWAAARVEEIALSDRGREAATDVALRAGLLTPWTGFLTGGAEGYVPSTFATRLLDLSIGQEAGFAAAFATPRMTPGALSDVPREVEVLDDGDDKEDALKTAIAAAAARRLIEEAGASVRACRDSRAALRPELGGTLSLSFDVDGDGRADAIKVRGSMDDESLDRCVQVVVQGFIFPASGLKTKISVSVTIDLPPPRASLGGRTCSATATLPLPHRRGVWRERLDRMAMHLVYLEAKQSCEAPTWTDRRALIELMLMQNEDGIARVNLARELERIGETDAAALVRREAVRRARSPEELHRVRIALIGDERYPVGLFKKQYTTATDDKARLGVVRRYLAVAPHDARLRRRLVALLEALGEKQALADEIRLFRRDPFADAGLLADGASALRRIGDEAEARRAFGELAERAPADPWARAFLGDRLRNEGWFEESIAAYAVLEELVPDEPLAILRLASAHAGKGSLDVAARMLTRVTQTGGRTGDGKLGDLAGRLATLLLLDARGKSGVSPADAARLDRAASELPLPSGSVVFLVRAPAGARAIDAMLVRGPKEAREERAPDASAEGVGLYSLRLDASDTSATLKLKRPADLPPSAATKVRIDAIIPGANDAPPKLVTTEIELPITGKPVEVSWANGAFGG